MNRYEWLKVNHATKNISFPDRSHVNCVRFNVGNTFKHEERKFLKCWELKEEGQHFVTEARTLDRARRIDVLHCEEMIAYEFETSPSETKPSHGVFTIETVRL